MENREGDALLKVKEAASLLRVSFKTLYKWAERNKGPRHVNDLDGYVRFWKSDIMDWLRANEKQGDAA